jgi:hypothetical protein
VESGFASNISIGHNSAVCNAVALRVRRLENAATARSNAQEEENP